MSDLDDNLLAAWERIQPRLLSDPTELARRLARRRTPTLTRPPRAMCLAVRASDTRINPATAIIVPEDAVYLNCLDHPYQFVDHEITLDAQLIRLLCAPVWLDPRGEDQTQLARKLGCRPSSLHRARHAGMYSVRVIQNLGGRWGNPVPVLHFDRPLDPNFGNLRQPPDRIWGAIWQHLPDAFPNEFAQTVTRVPRYRSDNRADQRF